MEFRNFRRQHVILCPGISRHSEFLAEIPLKKQGLKDHITQKVRMLFAFGMKATNQIEAIHVKANEQIKSLQILPSLYF